MEEGEERTIKKWLRKLSPPILDVGCGTGRYTIKIVERCSEVIALDVSRTMLKKTVEKANAVLERINPILADGEHLPFRNESFNGLICTLTFDHFENCESVAREFSRVLRRDGLCILSTFKQLHIKGF